MGLLSLGNSPPVDRSAQPSAHGIDALPSTADITCDGTGTHVLTPRIRPQHDGVHFRIDNRREQQLAFVALFEGSVGDFVPAGVSEIVLPIPPGGVSIGCRSIEQIGDRSTFQPLEIVDEDQVWISTTPDCEQAAGADVEAPVGDKDPFEAVRRYFRGLKPEDIVEPAGYPQAVPPTLRASREGRVIAAVEFVSGEQGTWLLDVVGYCTDLGLAG